MEQGRGVDCSLVGLREFGDIRALDVRRVVGDRRAGAVQPRDRGGQVQMHERQPRAIVALDGHVGQPPAENCPSRGRGRGAKFPALDPQAIGPRAVRAQDQERRVIGRRGQGGAVADQGHVVAVHGHAAVQAVGRARLADDRPAVRLGPIHRGLKRRAVVARPGPDRAKALRRDPVFSQLENRPRSVSQITVMRRSRCDLPIKRPAAVARRRVANRSDPIAGNRRGGDSRHVVKNEGGT